MTGQERSDLRIRPAAAADAAAIAALSRQLGYPADPAEIVERLAAIVDRGDALVLVAEDEEGTVAGWIHVMGSHLLEGPPRAEITGLIVDEAHRRLGLGAALMAAAEAWAASSGYGEVRLRSNVVREQAHSFYEQLGYARTKTQLVFAKTIDLGRRRSTQRL
jgi:GNAT superfamily N-acetyltransferase